MNHKRVNKPTHLIVLSEDEARDLVSEINVAFAESHASKPLLGELLSILSGRNL